MATSYSIGDHFEGFIDELIESGRYSTASEVMREGLRLLEEREERRRLKLEALRAEIQKGFDSGPAEEVEKDMLRRIKEQGRKRLASASVANRPRKTSASRTRCHGDLGLHCHRQHQGRGHADQSH